MQGQSKVIGDLCYITLWISNLRKVNRLYSNITCKWYTWRNYEL